MDFSAALKASKPEDRATLARQEIERHPWGGALGGLMSRGGWPESEAVRRVEIRETDAELVADVLVSYVESTSSGCSLYERTYDGAAQFVVRVDRRSGAYTIRREDDVAADAD